jgi:hypothetical protein
VKYSVCVTFFFILIMVYAVSKKRTTISSDRVSKLKMCCSDEVCSLLAIVMYYRSHVSKFKVCCVQTWLPRRVDLRWRSLLEVGYVPELFRNLVL